MALSPSNVPFDLSQPTGGPVAGLLAGPAAALTAVALVVGESARGFGWGARAAIALAERWQGQRRVVLADLDLAQPSLHERLGIEVEEGVIDVIDYGVSLRRVLRPVRNGAFDLLAGNYAVAEPAEVLRSDAWRRVLHEVTAMRGTLLAYVPADLPGMDAVVARMGAVIVIADADEGATIVRRLPSSYAVLAVLTPAGAEAVTVGEPIVTAAAAEPVTEQVTRLSDEEFERIRLPTDRVAREELIREMRDRQRAARMEPTWQPSPAAAPAQNGLPAGGRMPLLMPSGSGDTALEMRLEAGADDLALETIDPGTRARPARYGTSLVWTVTVVAILAVLAGAWRYLNGRWDYLERAPAPVTDAGPEPVAPAAVIAPGDSLPFVVALEAHRDLSTAFDRVAALARAEPGLMFHVSPLERAGTLFYHVMAGPVPDSAGAWALRDTLIAHGHKTTRTPTDVRATPLAFLIGEHDDEDAAQAQLAELRRLDIPGYQITRASAPRFIVYVGGFATAAEADVIRQLLRAAGIRDSLVTRTGSITP